MRREMMAETERNARVDAVVHGAAQGEKRDIGRNMMILLSLLPYPLREQHFTVLVPVMYIVVVGGSGVLVPHRRTFRAAHERRRKGVVPFLLCPAFPLPSRSFFQSFHSSSCSKFG